MCGFLWCRRSYKIYFKYDVAASISICMKYNLLISASIFFVLGTSMYRAPELLHRYAPTKAADVWSMGVTALEVFTGE